MVRTRHSGELEGTDSPKLLSLDNEKERFRSTVPKREPVESGTSYHRGAYQDDEYDIFEDKVVDSRLRPRTGPGRAYNYLDADSSDDDNRRRHRRHSPHKELSPRSVKKELIERCSRRSRQLPSRLSLYQTDVHEDSHQPRRSQRQRTHQTVEDDSFQEDTRTIRSSHRKLTRRNADNDVQKECDESEDENKEHNSDDDEEAKDHDSDNEEENNGYSDMYSRVKRKRMRRSRGIYGEVEQNTNNNQRDDSDEEEEVTATRRSKRVFNKREEPQIVKSYSLREHKPRTDLYKAPVEERRIKKPNNSIFEVTPTKKPSRQPYQSPAQRRQSRKRSAAMHSSSSSTSSSSGESSDEKSFRKRKAKSMAKARSRMMPMNFSNSEPASGVIKDRVKSGASLADVEPMHIDKNITFDSIGGLGKHIRALKEMVVFPLLYDKVFQKFNVDPPRGVLFYGPPGTGKTLVARALANECSHGDKKVAFFMRKGADCLSKWVGESERQLRLLFDQAYKYRPSIIFFDEIDGLAPVRSSRQDQIHSSIVSTLLALMDGLDSRGEIVVIGATNRIDSLDPALRRPGRFDREFLFPLPTLDARKQILKIQTSSWNPKLNDRFITELAEKCVGYCGADLKSLCTEAAMLALRRRYPQIYFSNEALQLDESSIQVSAKDFFNAVSNIIPTSRRSVNAPGKPLGLHILPLLERQLNKAMSQLCDTFPACLTKMTSLDAAATTRQAHEQTDAAMLLDDLLSDEDEDAPSIYVKASNKNSRIQAKRSLDAPSTSRQVDNYLNFTSFATHKPTTFRPRIMLTGLPGQGQTTYIAPALIHKMEDLPVHVLDLPALYAVTAKTPEESCANVFHEARRKCPSIIYMPYINQWWDVLGDTLRTTLLTLIQDLDPTIPLLLLATSEQPYSCLDVQLKYLFNEMSGEVMTMSNPNADERKVFFRELILQHASKAPPQKKTAEPIFTVLDQSQEQNSLPNKQSINHENRRMKNFTKHVRTLTSRSVAECLRKNATFCDTNVNKSSVHKMVLRSTRLSHDRNNNESSVQKMVLRSTGPSHGCNNNSHSREQPELYRSIPGTTCGPKVDPFFPSATKEEVFNQFRLSVAKMVHDIKCRPTKSMSDVRDGTKSTSSMNANCSNNRQLRKINKVLNDLKLKLSDRHFRYLKRMNKSCPGNILSIMMKKKIVTGMRSCLSSGSAQMMYRQCDMTGPCSSSRSDPMLPINFQQLQTHDDASKPSTHCRYNLRSKSNHGSGRRNSKRMLEVLPKAAPVKPKELTNQEMNVLLEKEELTLMELRIFLRDVLHKLGSDKKFSIFTKPVDIENAPDYLDVIDHPMDMSTMMSKIDCHEYSTVRSFMNDIDLICSNALEYNPDRGPMDKVIRHRACALKDTAYAIIKTELDKEFEKMCVEIEESRKRRGVKSTTVPNFCRTKPVAQNADPSSKSTPVIPSYLDSTRPARSIPAPDGERFSRRVRGIEIDPVPSLEDVEKKKASGKKETDSNVDIQDSSEVNNVKGDGEESMMSQEDVNSENESATEDTGADDATLEGSQSAPHPLKSGAQTDPLHKKSSRKNKCVWCRPSRKRRKIFQDHLSSRKTMASASKTYNEDKKLESGHNQSPSVRQPLSIEVTESTETEVEMKSPIRKSTRIVSPNPLPAGVSTRRQSLSPRGSRLSLSKKPKETSEAEDSIHKTSVQEEPKELATEVITKQDESVVTEKTDVVVLDSAHVSELLGEKLEHLKEVVESAVDVKKSSVVKSLDLDFGVVDSGAGSSLEGNGDSRDSMDANRIEDPQSTSSSHPKDVNENNSQGLPTQDECVDFLESSNTLVVPSQKLSHILDRLVASTEGCSVEGLEKIYSQLSQIIYKHRHSYNRTEMANELEKKVEEMTRHLPSLSSRR